MFLHLSKCAGTSMLDTLAYRGFADFTLKLPRGLATASACGAAVSPKCCWWRERLHNMSLRGQQVKILQQEPANEVDWIDLDVAGRVARSTDPGFDAATDACPDDLAYLTVLRAPLARVKSHMCEIGAHCGMWLDPDVRRRGHVTTQLRDNYYVRALGGADAWRAAEGALERRHLLAAARTLAGFDVVMTVETLASDAPAQMGRVGLPGFQWRRGFARSRADNLQRATEAPWLRTAGVASCEVPPTATQLRRLVAASAWDAVLYEFARVLAARRTKAAGQSG